jgi:hypothetical protein
MFFIIFYNGSFSIFKYELYAICIYVYMYIHFSRRTIAGVFELLNVIIIQVPWFGLVCVCV